MSSAMFAIGILWMILGLIALLGHRVGDGCQMMIAGILFLIASDVHELLTTMKQMFSFLRSAERKEGD